MCVALNEVEINYKLNISCSVIWVGHRLVMETVVEKRIPHHQTLSFPFPTLLTSPEQRKFSPTRILGQEKRIELQCVIPSLKETKCLLINNT